MNVVTVAVCIVAAFLGALAWLLVERISARAWICAGAALLVALLVFAAGPAVLS